MSLEQLERCAEADNVARLALEKRLEEIEPLKSTVALLKSQLQQAQGALTAGQLALREDKEGKHDAEGKLAQAARDLDTNRRALHNADLRFTEITREKVKH